MSKFDEKAVSTRYNQVPSEDKALQYLKALKVIISADGVADPAELEALRKGMKRLGASEAVQKAVEEFKVDGVTLESVLPVLRKGGRRARYLLRDAVELSRADGTYAKEEKAAVAKAGALLGVAQDIIQSIEVLVEMEHAVRRLQKALLHKKG